MKVQSLKSYLLPRLRQCIRRARDEMLPRLRQCIGRARDEMALLPRLRQRIWRARDEIALLPRLPQSAIRLQTYSKLYKVSPLVFLPFKSLLFKLFFCFFFSLSSAWPLSERNSKTSEGFENGTKETAGESGRRGCTSGLHGWIRNAVKNSLCLFWFWSQTCCEFRRQAEFSKYIMFFIYPFSFSFSILSLFIISLSIISLFISLNVVSFSFILFFFFFRLLFFVHLEEKRWRMQQNFAGKNASRIPSLRKGPGQEQLAVLKRTETLSLVVPN